mgnify:CR=1 FL=1
MWFGLEQIRYLDAVSRLGSLGAASEELKRAKSAISKGLSNLEEQLGFELLDRSEYRLKITPKGTFFLQRAQELLISSKKLKELAKLIASDMELKVSISASELYPIDPLIMLLAKLRSNYPETEIEFRRETMSSLELLSDDIVNIAFTEQKLDSLEFESKALMNLELPIYLSSNHSFWDDSKASIESLRDIPNIVQASTIQTSNNASQHTGKKWRVNELDAKTKLIAAGLGWGRLPPHKSKDLEESGVIRRFTPANEPIKLTHYICHKRGRELGPVSKFIWNYFGEEQPS